MFDGSGFETESIQSENATVVEQCIDQGAENATEAEQYIEQEAECSDQGAEPMDESTQTDRDFIDDDSMEEERYVPQWRGEHGGEEGSIEGRVEEEWEEDMGVGRHRRVTERPEGITFEDAVIQGIHKYYIHTSKPGMERYEDERERVVEWTYSTPITYSPAVANAQICDPMVVALLGDSIGYQLDPPDEECTFPPNTIPLVLNMDMLLYIDLAKPGYNIHGARMAVPDEDFDRVRGEIKGMNAQQQYVPFVDVIKGYQESTGDQRGMHLMAIRDNLYYRCNMEARERVYEWLLSNPVIEGGEAGTHTLKYRRRSNQTPQRKRESVSKKLFSIQPQADSTVPHVVYHKPDGEATNRAEYEEYILQHFTKKPTPSDNNCFYHALGAALQDCIRRAGKPCHEVPMLKLKRDIYQHT